jgi:hypothetical protein
MNVPAIACGPPGYFNTGYTQSLSEFGHPLPIIGSRGSLLERAIGDTGLRDAMGGYPLFCCEDWSALRADLHDLRDRLVSVVVAPDPMSAPGLDLLTVIFDHVRRYRDHFVIRTGRRLDSFISRRHREHALKALRRIEVERCEDPWRFAGEFDRLFGVLAARHGIRGLRRFSSMAFARQFALPGLVMFRATTGGRTVGLDTWYLQGDCAQGHLSALDESAYDLHAAYAIKWRVIEYFNDKVEWIILGGGRSLDQSDGLSAFKRGWANDTRASWICGRVLQPERYASLPQPSADGEADYFPSYRRGEFD